MACTFFPEPEGRGRKMEAKADKGNLSAYLRPTAVIDSDHADLIDFAHQSTAGLSAPREQAIRLYYRVRDGIRYDPYHIDLSVPGMRASTTLKSGRGWCVPKAILLAAGCRVLGIPARLGFADVRNHLTTARLRRLMQTDIFYWHGYAAIYLDQKWIKATPAFNIQLCERFKLGPLEFDGCRDSIFHPFDQLGHQHMEYVRYRGEMADAPLDEIRKTFERYYSADLSTMEASFENDVNLEQPDRG
jgi:transglutaminase-like putative cysteine protease